MLGLGDDHAIDQDAGNPDPRRVERAGLGDALDLAQHDTARVARGQRHGEIFEPERLLLHGDVAVGIGGRAADEGDVDRQSLVEQGLLAVERDQIDDVVVGRLVDLAALDARIDEGVKPEPG